jgi:hypothetical protein
LSCSFASASGLWVLGQSPSHLAGEGPAVRGSRAAWFSINHRRHRRGGGRPPTRPLRAAVPAPHT